ncbi:hypothetical protein ABB37_08870 [Leptomonas pyrrhocoris]|uniref:Reverse transcriptase domain-containing protein n=1 Tax=Leptomonas pyrrhocoris TaxID=157538 RepID=A0A0N0VDC1_LEPPY|nr:hypothetical protein ABB37_08870 [Leptomonas pyrrhocoris]KPA74858.1 hypothetical protein ABB37_08870 [Leptomonas pyrrhocoris]|eukprot:XP_015653297.1 hypothetical protein ABB37_08870 [Leptomonas pyrrhocoris]
MTAPWVAPEEKPFKSGFRHALQRRVKDVKVATRQQTFELPLQQVDVAPVNLAAVVRRMNATTKRRFDEIWFTVGTPPPLPLMEPKQKLFGGDAQALFDANILELADDTPTAGWFKPFTVVEEKESGWRRRFIAWTEAKNTSDYYEPEVPLTHISNHLAAVHEKDAATIDLKASFFQLPLPQEWRCLFRCRTADGRLVQMTRLPMGYRVSPEILHTVTRVLAGDPEVVQPQFACDAALQLTVWIDNVRAVGDSERVRAWFHRTLQNAASVGATVGESCVGSPVHNFLGVRFDHEHRTVSMGEKFLRHRKETPRWSAMTVFSLLRILFLMKA